MFINNAFAAAEPVVNAGGGLGATLMQLGLILLIFYFLLIRPQQKRVKEHNDMVNALKVGDKVLTNGGIYGRVSKLNGSELSLEIAPNVEISVERMAVNSVITEDKAPSAEATETKEVKTKTTKSKAKNKTKGK
jgi:preprotein translocase subunit YajC